MKRSMVIGALAGLILGAGGVLFLASLGVDDSAVRVACTTTRWQATLSDRVIEILLLVDEV